MYAKQDKQMRFYDEPVYAQTVPPDHFLRRLNTAVNLSFVNELCRDLYCLDNGRPSWEPQLLFKALLLKFLYNLNDYTAKSFMVTKNFSAWTRKVKSSLDERQRRAMNLTVIIFKKLFLINHCRKLLPRTKPTMIKRTINI